MKKLLIIGVIALFIGLAFIPSFNAVSTNNETLQFCCILVYIKEIYGTIENPQYRPLPNVTVEIKIKDLFYWSPHWIGKTHENGWTEDIFAIWGVYYKVEVSKEDYHTYKCSPHKGFSTEPGVYIYEVRFTMAEDGSPFNETKSSAGNTLNEEDCLECQSNGKTHLAEKILNKLEKDEVLSNVIDSINPKEDPPICDYIIDQFEHYWDLVEFYADQSFKYQNGSLMHIIYISLVRAYLLISGIYLSIALLLDCDIFPYYP